MNEERSLRIILSPHMSEKASRATQMNNEYVFEVRRDANKTDVKKAIEYLFNTKVDEVRIVNVKSKPRRFGQIIGTKKGWKKAYVKLPAGQAIDFSGLKDKDKA